MTLQRPVSLTGGDRHGRSGDNGSDEVVALIAPLNNLASVLSAEGDLSGARTHLERAVEVAEAALGPDHPDVGTSLNNLGSVLQDLGDLAGAKACYKRALVIAEGAYRPDSALAIGLSNLGCLLFDQGELAGARAYLERALALAEAAFGADNADVETIRQNLSRVKHADPPPTSQHDYRGDTGRRFAAEGLSANLDSMRPDVRRRENEAN